MSATRIVNVKCEDLREHPEAGIVPDMEPEMWEAFKEDIRINGVQEPILVCKTTVIDGRQRLRVQKALHVETIPVRYEEMTPKQQLERLIRTALLRRHLNESQRALLAVRLKPKLANSDSVKSSEKSTSDDRAAIAARGRANDLAGKAVNVSGDSVARAEKVIAKAEPEIVKMVDAGDLSVAAASVVADLPKREQQRLAKQGPKAAKKTAAKIRKSKIAGGTEFPVDQIEAANDEATKEDRTDSLNGTVPDDLVDVFSQCRKWQQAMNAVSQAKKTVTEFKDHRAAMFLDFQELDRLLTQARVNLKFAMPYTECPKCRRKLKSDCPHCKGQGWLNKATFTACASDADKGWLENRK